MKLISDLRRYTATTTGRRVLAVLGVALVLIMASNPELVPLATLVDMVGLDVLVLLLGSQLLATLPWLADYTRRAVGHSTRGLAGLAAGAMGGYLRQLVLCPGHRAGLVPAMSAARNIQRSLRLRVTRTRQAPDPSPGISRPYPCGRCD